MSSQSTVKLGLNIDHVATVRQARGGAEPNIVRAALEGVRGGADGVTVHLREDRRHIQDRDLFELKDQVPVPLNLEMSVAEEILRVACRLKPAKVCLVPERRQELTTEGGLDVVSGKKRIAEVVDRLHAKGILVSLFINAMPKQVQAAYDVDCDFIELHTGRYANQKGKRRAQERDRLREGALQAHSLGMGVNAGHGLDYENVESIARLPHLRELNIGHSIVAHALYVGLARAVRQMCALIRNASNRARR